MRDKIEEFAKSFGINASELPILTTECILNMDFSLNELTDIERDKLLIKIIEKIRNDKQKIASFERKKVWDSGWEENFSIFKHSKNNDDLIPKFIRRGEVIRWFSKFYLPNNNDFEIDYIKVLRTYIYETFLNNIENIYEFGAGTGFNLVHFAELNPSFNLIGTDFVQSSVDLMALVGSIRKINLKSELFDMLNPENSKIRIQNNSAVLTFGSLEQLGGDIEPFFNYLIGQSPSIVVHVEPMVETYNQNILEDYLAFWFQSNRGYTTGIMDLLQKYEKDSRIKILKFQRLNFGSLMMEGFNLVCWKKI